MFFTELILNYLTFIHPLVVASERLDYRNLFPQQPQKNGEKDEGSQQLASPAGSTTITTPGSATFNSSSASFASTVAGQDDLSVITELTLIFVLSWLVELIDVFFVYHVFALRELWVLARIGFCLWLNNSKTKAAMAVQVRVVSPLLVKHGASLDASMTVWHDRFESEGLMKILQEYLPSPDQVAEFLRGTAACLQPKKALPPVEPKEGEVVAGRTVKAEETAAQ